MSNTRSKVILSEIAVPELQPLAKQYEEQIEYAEKVYQLESSNRELTQQEYDSKLFYKSKLGIHYSETVLPSLKKLHSEYHSLFERDTQLKLAAKDKLANQQMLKLMSNIANTMTSITNAVTQLTLKVDKIENSITKKPETYSPRFGFNSTNEPTENKDLKDSIETPKLR